MPIGRPALKPLGVSTTRAEGALSGCDQGILARARRPVEGRERAPWPAIAAILVIARLCEPASELHIAEYWYRRTALDDLLGVPAERVNDDRPRSKGLDGRRHGAPDRGARTAFPGMFGLRWKSGRGPPPDASSATTAPAPPTPP